MTSNLGEFVPEFSKEGQGRQFGQLKTIVSGPIPKKDAVLLHGGLPPAEAFPLISITASSAQDTTFSVPVLDAQRQYDIPASGLPSLQAWCAQHTKQFHAPPPPLNHQTIITDGSTHALELLTSLFLEPGDPIMVEEYTYPHFVEAICQPKQYELLPLAMDHHGIIPSSLERLLEERKIRDLPQPRVLYTVPTGQNPTSATTTSERKQQIYSIIRQYSNHTVIIEDDPYYYLQFSITDNCSSASTHQPGLLHLASSSSSSSNNNASFLSLDVDGRVIRLDSFAKFLAPGLRLGWATASPCISQKLVMAVQAHTVGACMMSQAITAALLSSLGEQGLHAHLVKTQSLYASRAAAALRAVQTHLVGRGLAEVNVPTAGMFLWVRLTPDIKRDTVELMPMFREEGVLVVPGKAAWVGGAPEEERSSGLASTQRVCLFIRLAFSNASVEQLERGIQRIASVVERVVANANVD